MAEQLLSDGMTDFLGGQDASKFPSRLPANAYYSGINISIQNSLPTPRWGLDKRNFNFTKADFKVSNGVLIPYEEIFHSGRFQACIPYTIGGDSYLLVVVSGIMFLMNINTYFVDVIALPNDDTLNENAPRLNWSNAGKYLVIFDYPNFPVILDGITARRADPGAYEVPVSTIGAYNQNRLFIGNAGAELTAGDPSGSLAAPEAPITFKEVEQPAAAFFGQIFELPTDVTKERITAMAFLEFIDNSTGIGPLLVATDDYIFSYNSQNPRSTWDQGTFGTLLVSDGGIAGPRSFINVNADLFFLGSDGQVRTLSMARSEQQKWSRVPVSKEVQNWLIANDVSLLKFGVLGHYLNKVFITVNPHRVTAYSRNRTPIFDVAHGGFAVLELDNLANIQGAGPPAWAGMWTGVRPMDLVASNKRFFVVSKDEGSTNEIYEWNINTTYDTDAGVIRYARAKIQTREYDLGTPFQNKELHSMDMGFRNVKGDFKVDVRYKPSHGSQFDMWQTFSHAAPWRSCDVPDGCELNGLAGHSFRDLTIGNPVENSCDEVSKLIYNSFRKVQFEFTIEGAYWEFHEFVAKTQLVPKNEQTNICNLFNPVKLCQQCNDDWYIGAFKSCSLPKT